MRIRFLGAAKEVGRSAVLVDTGRERIMLDYGVAMGGEPRFPVYVSPKDINATVVSHAHLDHSGAVPLFFLHEKARVIATRMTFSTARVLLADFIKLSGYFLPFEFLEVDHMLRVREEVGYHEGIRVGDAELELLDAGHIPGSSQILLQADKRILYTGDYSSIESRLLKPADPLPDDLDAVIIESTYGNEANPERHELEAEFIRETYKVVSDGGTVLVPAFSVGRSQEILSVFAAHKFKYPVVLDGMATKILSLYLEDGVFIKDHSLLSKAANRVDIISGKKKRRQALDRPGVIVSPAGMLGGGPAAYYMQRVAGQSRNAVFLVSYQVPGTSGALLLEENRYILRGKETRVNANVKQFKFSSHSGRDELHSLLERLEPGTKVYAVHGERESCEGLAQWARENLDLDAVAPEAGESFEI